MNKKLSASCAEKDNLLLEKTAALGRLQEKTDQLASNVDGMSAAVQKRDSDIQDISKRYSELATNCATLKRDLERRTEAIIELEADLSQKRCLAEEQSTQLKGAECSLENTFTH